MVELSPPYVKSSLEPKTLSETHFRVCGPVIGLNRIPSVMPASRRVEFRPLWSLLPWTRSAACRSSSSAYFRLSCMSLSVATRLATVVTPRLPISSS